MAQRERSSHRRGRLSARKPVEVVGGEKEEAERCQAGNQASRRPLFPLLSTLQSDEITKTPRIGLTDSIYALPPSLSTASVSCRLSPPFFSSASRRSLACSSPAPHLSTVGALPVPLAVLEEVVCEESRSARERRGKRETKRTETEAKESKVVLLELFGVRGTEIVSSSHTRHDSDLAGGEKRCQQRCTDEGRNRQGTN